MNASCTFLIPTSFDMNLKRDVVLNVEAVRDVPN